MGVVRRVIFPTLRLIIWAVIAVALVKLAFAGADVKASGDPLQPTGSVTEPTVQVEQATITNTVDVEASVVADPPVPVKATAAGTVAKLLAADGATVAAGDPVLQVRQETPQDPVTSTDPTTGDPVTTQPAPKVTTTVVKATAGGVLSLPTLKDQVVAVGDVVATVTPGTLSVTGTLTADQQYRLVNAPSEAQVTLKGGPAPFACTGLKISTQTTGSTPSEGGGAAPSTTSGTISCAVPAGVVAFAGLGADLAVTNGTADGPTVPVTAVQGSVQNGNVWVVADGKEPEQRAVTLGLTDGKIVEITSGLAVGDTVLQFIPVPGGASGPVDCTDPRQYDPTVCGG
ncbi:secretion protein HlyD [Cellulomonas citrea]|uniref:secretion protein HlyD n=1 Tax=Cellulomonas citrea TaxID=1909423 RepID=UPI001357A3AF|nr:secretion protein HlyD [Cellulomonas citrea]